VSVSRYASVVPLVSTRALARPFTYLVEDAEVGTIVSVPFGRARRRGVVVALDDAPPKRIETTAPLPTPSGTSYVNARATARDDTSG